MSWQSQTSSLKEKIKYLFDSKEMSDITVIVGKDKVSFQTHSWLLSIFSEVFHNMFYGPEATKTSQIVLPDDNANVFDIFIKYVYTDRVELNSEDEAILGLTFAHKYKVSHMKKQCLIYLSKITPDVLAEITESVSLTPSSSSRSSAQLKNENICGNETILKSCNMQNEKSSETVINPNHVCTSSMKDVHQALNEMQPNFESSNEIYMSAEMGPNLISNDSYPINPSKPLKSEVRDNISNFVFDALHIPENKYDPSKFEEILKYISGGNLYPEINIPAVLREWGLWCNRQSTCDCVQLTKLSELLQNQLKLLLERSHENVCFRLQNNTPNLLKLSSRCNKSWVSSSEFPCIEERFKSRECDLYVYGVTLNFKLNTNLDKKIDLEAKLEISNLTRNTRSNKKISVYLDVNNRPISLKLEYPVFIGRDEICKIVVKSDSKLENCEFIYCGGDEACALDNRLEKLSTDAKTSGHFSAIIVLTEEELKFYV